MSVSPAHSNAQGIPRFSSYQGMCDASAAVAISLSEFAVANDEDNALRIYDRRKPGPPIQYIDLSQQLGVESKSPETDIEGAARIGDVVFWITSHARNKEGKLRPNRRRFFATTFKRNGAAYEISIAGSPYRKLLDDLIDNPQLRPFGLAAASERAPKSRDALNIEGLCATPEGDLLIGFRNPLPKQQALIVPLQNPAALLRGEHARFGDPILLDLGGLGVRELVAHNGHYIIVAGSYDGSGASKLFHWRGPGTTPRLLHIKLDKDLNPEAVILYDDTHWREAMLLSDDGTVSVNGIPCKELPNDSDRWFRSFTVNFEPLLSK